MFTCECNWHGWIFNSNKANSHRANAENDVMHESELTFNLPSLVMAVSRRAGLS